MKYNIGDRVKYLGDEPFITYGSLGTIVEIGDGEIYVEWDDAIGDKLWYVRSEEVEKISNITTVSILGKPAGILSEALDLAQKEVELMMDDIELTLKQVDIAKKELQVKVDEVQSIKKAIKLLEKNNGSKSKKTK